MPLRLALVLCALLGCNSHKDSQTTKQSAAKKIASAEGSSTKRKVKSTKRKVKSTKKKKGKRSAKRQPVKRSAYLGRVMAALAKSPKVRLSDKSRARIASNRGSVMIDAPDNVSRLPAKTVKLGLFDDPEVKKALLGTDEETAANIIYSKGVRTLIVHYGVAENTDVGKRVLSRLYHHDYLTRFQLMRVAKNAFLYRVRKSSVKFDAELATRCLRYLRDRLAGKKPTIEDERSETGQWTFVASIRGQGRELAVAFGQDKKLAKSLDEVAKDLERYHRRRKEYFGFPPLKDHLADLRIEIQRVTERAYLEPRDDQFIAQFWELGIDGTLMLTKNRKKRAVLPGSAAYTRALNRPEKFLKDAAKEGRMPSKRPWREKGSWLEMFRTIHYTELPGSGIRKLYRGFKEVPLSDVTVKAVKNAVVSAGEWYLSNLRPDGSVVYKFWPESNRYTDENNIVRHALSTWNLVQAYELDPRPEFLEAAKKTLGFTERHRVEENSPEFGDMVYYRYKDNVKLGTAVITILGLIDMAKATDSKEYDDLLVKLGNFTKFMAQDSGKFLGYHVPKGHAYHGKTNDIVPGEAALALIRLAEYFDDNAWIASLDKYWAYYMRLFRKRAASRNINVAWPWYVYDNTTRLALVQMGPWTVMAANAYHRRTGNKEVAAFGLEVARWMIDTYQWTSERSPWPDYVGGYFKLREELPAMQTFCYAEGTAAAYQLALRYAPEQVAYFEKSTREAMRLGLAMQYTDLDTYGFSRPNQVMGGIRYALNETKVRIDYVHHALSSMYLYYQGALVDPNLPASVKNAGAASSLR
ncbi:MAG: hypothetical protein VX589_08110 [Myxococcota bacterium]|nr:hypothetical protein [Myxococcota bacterium]